MKDMNLAYSKVNVFYPEDELTTHVMRVFRLARNIPDNQQWCAGIQQGLFPREYYVIQNLTQLASNSYNNSKKWFPFCCQSSWFKITDS